VKEEQEERKREEEGRKEEGRRHFGGITPNGLAGLSHGMSDGWRDSGGVTQATWQVLGHGGA
jgi:hypothetical protein